MRVIQSGYNYRHDANYKTVRPDGLEDYLLLIIRSPALFTIDGIDHAVSRNAVILYRKGTPQFFCAHNADFINDWVQFEMNEEDLAFCDSIQIPLDQVIELPDVSKLSHLAALLFEERWSSTNANTEESKSLLIRLLLLKLSDLIADGKQNLSPFHMRLKILQYDIQASPHLDWSINSICKRLSISKTHLYVSYKELFGKSIQEEITSSRIERAKRFLTTTNYSITTIANMIGYHNDVHFMYMFKNRTGFTPSQYRRSFDSYFDYRSYETPIGKAPSTTKK